MEKEKKQRDKTAADREKKDFTEILEQAGIQILKSSLELDGLIKDEGPDIAIFYISTALNFKDFEPYQDLIETYAELYTVLSPRAPNMKFVAYDFEELGPHVQLPVFP